MKVVLFPANKLGATISPIFNGHTAIVCQNTDRLRDFEHETPEIEAFRNNLQLTSFLNPRGAVQTRDYRGAIIPENADYSKLLEDVGGSGRISFGMYWNVNIWKSPITGTYQAIPDFSASAWTSAGANVFANAVIGQSKPTNYPGHGKQMYDISNGDFGFDTATGQMGLSNLEEMRGWNNEQLNILYGFGSGLITSISYMNGANALNPVIMPYFLAGRNSVTSKYGDLPTDPSMPPNEREKFINYRSSTRCWDSAGGGSGNETTWLREIGYAKEQIDLAISQNGIYTDFTHWHSVYITNTLPYFSLYYSEIGSYISGKNVWSAGYNEAFEYYFIRELIRENVGVGSFENEGKVYVTLEVYDKYKDTYYDFVNRGVDISLLKTPISIEVNLSGTSLSGKNIECKSATSVRSLGGDIYILNVPYLLNEEFYLIAEITESLQSDYYNDSTPVISINGNSIETDLPSKISIWRKPVNAEDWEIRNVSRNNNLLTERVYNFESGFDYYIGAISQFRHSSLITTAL